MIYLALGLLLLGVALGGRRAGTALRRAWGVWRPAAGLLTVVLFVGALVLAVREAWIPAALLALAGAWLALVARYRDPAQQKTTAPGMSRAEASAILGVEPDASADEIKAAYRRLMRIAHPDGGGSKGLAAQLNAARAALLGGRVR